MEPARQPASQPASQSASQAPRPTREKGTHVARRFTGLLAGSIFSTAILAAIFLVTGCTSTRGSSRSASSQGPSLSPDQVMPLFLQCLAEHNVAIWDKAQGDTTVVSLGEAQGWYENGHVITDNALYTDADGLEGFSPISSDFKPEQTIATWLDNAVSNGTWPKVCTPLP